MFHVKSGEAQYNPEPSEDESSEEDTTTKASIFQVNLGNISSPTQVKLFYI